MNDLEIHIPDILGEKEAPPAEEPVVKPKVVEDPPNPYIQPPNPFRVWKFPIKFDAVTTISMPMGAEVLSAQTQLQPGGEKLAIWAKVPADPDVGKEVRSFAAIGTGTQKHFAIKQFIDTVQFNHGNYVCHVFEVK
jgi:hypothetical protein